MQRAFIANCGGAGVRLVRLQRADAGYGPAPFITNEQLDGVGFGALAERPCPDWGSHGNQPSCGAPVWSRSQTNHAMAIMLPFSSGLPLRLSVSLERKHQTRANGDLS